MNSDVKVIQPRSVGWLEKKLDQEEIDYLWKRIEKSGGNHKGNLAGHISASKTLTDEDDWFFNRVILPLCLQYNESFGAQSDALLLDILMSTKYESFEYFLKSMWVNYQKQNEFNPLHNHGGLYSFVIWMKIPTKHFIQNKNSLAKESNSRVISSFEISYVDILGNIRQYPYRMNPNVEGTMLFFPSKLNHQVYPFYDCDEDRISISGNVCIQ
jgi:hypothetical protein|tara:strand:+ start:146 stop:784 length:639 start_codon:yes stop_codon:yes gene_type:complete